MGNDKPLSRPMEPVPVESLSFVVRIEAAGACVMLCTLLESESVADGISDASSSTVGKDFESLAAGRSSETMLEEAKPNVLVAESLEMLGASVPRSVGSSDVSYDGDDEARLVLPGENGTTVEAFARAAAMEDCVGSELSLARADEVGTAPSVLSEESTATVEESVNTTAVGDGLESELVVMTESASSAVASSATGDVKITVAAVVAMVEVESNGSVKVARSLVVLASCTG